MDSSVKIAVLMTSLMSFSADGTILVPLIRSGEETIGALYLPESHGNGGFILDVAFGDNLPDFARDPRTPKDLGNVMVDINMTLHGNAIRNLPEPINICLREMQSSHKVCLIPIPSNVGQDSLGPSFRDASASTANGSVRMSVRHFGIQMRRNS